MHAAFGRRFFRVAARVGRNKHDARQRMPHWLMREAIIRQYVEREERREAFRQDGINAWNEYQAVGLHVTLEEADGWLAKLEAGQEVEPPECHV